jgi:hypothetical protein
MLLPSLVTFFHDDLGAGALGDYNPPYIKAETKVELKLDCCLLRQNEEQ